MGNSKQGGQSKVRETGDRVGSEGLKRWEVDRKLGTVNWVYAHTFNRWIAPFTAAKRVMRESGRLAILDVGCGTGRLLYDFMSEARALEVCSPENVTGTGVSRCDYSDESMDPAVRAAIAEGDITYVVGQAEQMRRLKVGTFDIVIAHELMRHVRQPRLVLEELRAAAGETGIIYLNTPSQNGQPAPREARTTFDEWRVQGYTIQSRPSTTIHAPTNQTIGTSQYTVVLPPAPL